MYLKGQCCMQICLNYPLPVSQLFFEMGFLVLPYNLFLVATLLLYPRGNTLEVYFQDSHKFSLEVLFINSFPTLSLSCLPS